MNWVTLLWAMGGAAGVTIGCIHLGIWFHERQSLANLVFSLIAFSVAAIGVTEVNMMHSTTPEQWAAWVRWFHLPNAFTTIAIIVFVRLYFGTGRPWLAWLVVLIRSIVLVGNFAMHPNFNYRQVLTLRRLQFLGESVAAPGIVVPNRWQWLPTLGVLLFAAFVVDATVALWRRGGKEQRRKALTVGGGLIAFLFLAIGQTQLMLWGILRGPVLVTPFFLITVAAMGWDLSRDLLLSRRAFREAEELRRELARVGRVAILGQLASALAHDLNQPLTANLSNAQAAQRLLDRNPAEIDEVKAILKDIVAETQRAGDIIRGMRNMVKKGDARLGLQDIDAIIRETLLITHAELVARNVSVSVKSAPELPPVNGDRVQLQQVILNLIINGCDAMSGNRPDHRLLRIESERSQPNEVQISVTDEGPGIAPELRERIFDAFYTTKPKGLGLGLALSRTVAQAHAGRLWASNSPGGGATFHFTLPAARTIGN